MSIQPIKSVDSNKLISPAHG
jgi:hypothetical protein